MSISFFVLALAVLAALLGLAVIIGIVLLVTGSRKGKE
jgi:hypothetical protein